MLIKTRLFLIAACCAAALLPATASAGTPFTIGSLTFDGNPTVVTDPATGTGYFAWTANDFTLQFCAIPRGGTGCTPATIWNPGNSNPNEVGTPQLLRDTDGTLYVVMHRYVNDSVWVLKSTNNGATFTPTKISSGGSGTDFTGAVLGPQAGKVTTSVFNPSRYVRTASLDGSQAGTNSYSDLPSPIPFSAYDFQVARTPAGGLLTVANDLSSSYFWLLNPAVDPNTVGNWSGISTPIGPAGVSELVGTPTGQPILWSTKDNNVSVRVWNGGTFGAAQALETESGYIPGSGASNTAVAFGYRVNGSGSPNKLRVAVTKDNGGSWQQTTIDLSDQIYNDLDVSPADDGQGWAVWEGSDKSVRVTDFSQSSLVTTTPPPGGNNPTTGGKYTGKTTTKTVTDKQATYKLGGVPKACINPGATFKVTLKWTRKKRKGNLFVKVRRSDFYIGTKRVKIDKKAPFSQTLTVTASTKRGSTQTVRARAFIKVKKGKSPTKSIKATFKVCA